MTTKGWDARAFQRRQARGSASGGRAGRGQARLAAGLVAVLALASAAVAVAQVGGPEPSDSGKVGICHATGSLQHPHLFLVVDRNGAEHAHHVAHEGDFIGVESEAECAPAAASGPAVHDHEAFGCPSQTPEAPAEDGAEPGLPPPPAPPAPPEPAAETGEGSENETPAACAADVALTGTGLVAGQRVQFDFLVVSVGANEANNVSLHADLPDVGRPWSLTGTDAAACELVGRAIACRFGDLLPAEQANVGADALHCPQDCGEDVGAQAATAAANDANPANDGSAPIIDIEDCPDAGDAGPAPEPEPGDPAPPANDTGPSNETTPENSPTPAPPAPDLRVAAIATQDDVEVLLTIRVWNAGPSDAQDVVLRDTLPDVRRTWLLGGPDADACTLEGRELVCGFGGLAPGEPRTVSVKAFTDNIACGHHLTNTAVVEAAQDANPANNRSSAGIEAPPC